MKTRKKKRQEQPETFLAAIIPTESHLVLRDGKPCTLINVFGLHKGGVLLPGSPVALFDKVRDARRAIERTQAARKKLRTSLFPEWLSQQIPSFIAGAKFEIVPVGHQTEPAAQLLAPTPAAEMAVAS